MIPIFSQIFILLLILLIPSVASSLTFKQTGTEGVLEYTEPNETAKGSPLTDLKQTVGEYDLQDGNGPVPLFTEPASAATGNGFISKTITVPVGPMEEHDVIFCVHAEDLVTNQGKKKCTTERIDRLPPGEIR